MEIKKYMPVSVKTLTCYVPLHYGFEDCKINDHEDSFEGTLVKNLLPDVYIAIGSDNDHISTAYGGIKIVIELDSGKVLNWSKGVVGDICTKSCDGNFFILKDENDNIIHQTAPGDTEYVIGPSFMNEYGDYFTLSVDESGYIKNYDHTDMQDSLSHWVNEDA